MDPADRALPCPQRAASAQPATRDRARSRRGRARGAPGGRPRARRGAVAAATPGAPQVGLRRAPARAAPGARARLPRRPDARAGRGRARRAARDDQDPHPHGPPAAPRRARAAPGDARRALPAGRARRPLLVGAREAGALRSGALDGDRERQREPAPRARARHVRRHARPLSRTARGRSRGGHLLELPAGAGWTDLPGVGAARSHVDLARHDDARRRRKRPPDRREPRARHVARRSRGDDRARCGTPRPERARGRRVGALAKATRDFVSGRERECGVRSLVRAACRGRRSRRGITWRTGALEQVRAWPPRTLLSNLRASTPESLSRRLRRPRHGLPPSPLATSLAVRPRPETKSRVGFSDFRLVDVAPAPVLSWFEGLDDRVPRVLEVLGCVPVRRGVAAADVAAAEAQAQVDPVGAHREAFLATLGARGDLADLSQVRILVRGHEPSTIALRPAAPDGGGFSAWAPSSWRGLLFAAGASWLARAACAVRRTVSDPPG